MPLALGLHMAVMVVVVGLIFLAGLYQALILWRLLFLIL